MKIWGIDSYYLSFIFNYLLNFIFFYIDFILGIYFMKCIGNQLQEYADSLEGRLADAEVEEESTKQELTELKNKYISIDMDYEKNKKQLLYEKDQNLNLEKKIKELSDIINKNNEEKNSFDDLLLEKVSDTVKAEEIKSFLFLDSIIQVF